MCTQAAAGDPDIYEGESSDDSDFVADESDEEEEEEEASAAGPSPFGGRRGWGCTPAV